jgi:hypothetical protein
MPTQNDLLAVKNSGNVLSADAVARCHMTAKTRPGPVPHRQIPLAVSSTSPHCLERA